MRWRKMIGLLLLCMTLVTVAACGSKEAAPAGQNGSSTTENSSEGDSAALKDVKVVLDWTPIRTTPGFMPPWIKGFTRQKV